MTEADDVGVVAIGRNEGARLRLCLLSLQNVRSRVYVDSGSTDGSQRVASELGFELVQLAIPPGFTAARARNLGLRRLLELNPRLDFVQMVDGDCEVAPNWIATARAELVKDPELAVVFGRRRERFPDASIYNMICDDEWDVPVGEANSCGGDAMFRVAALVAAGGYKDSLIAGEEPDLCLRLRQSAWRIRRLPAEMTVHDVAMSRFRQWWKRTLRGGHAFAELAYRHGRRSDPMWVRQLMSIGAWAALGLLGLGCLAAGLLLASWWLIAAAAAIGLLFAAQFLRLVLRRRAGGMPLGRAVPWASLTILGKFPQLQGVLQFHWKRLFGSSSRLIEYKS